ncbi:MAG: DNA polymerase III subunit delta [Prevotellaceae bacterium]|jgi:DNA polymerase-3 subunit delta'|nr:DNA polymerase III subunit delta [Prevotellaceae bacterium]
MLFKEITGQYELKRQLIQTVTDKRISHAQLFVGSEGSGNLALAIAYAQYICCQNKQDGDSCGHCKSCIKFQKLVHPDLHFAFPVNTIKNSKQKRDEITSDSFIAEWRKLLTGFPYLSEQNWYEYLGIENKQGNIGKSDAEAIQQKMIFKPFEAEYKFMIIWLPERMNTTAANKLLKLIEEPPANTLFLLASKNIDQIIKTILSRTQLIRVPSVDTQSMQKMLAEKYDLSPNETQVLTRLAAGDVLAAIKIYERHEAEQDFFDNFKLMMRFAYAQKFVELLNWVEEIVKLGREQQKSFLHFCQQMIRETFIMNMQIQNISYLTDREQDFAQKLSQFITPKNVESIYAALNLAASHIEHNGNQKIIFSDLAIKFAELLIKT